MFSHYVLPRQKGQGVSGVSFLSVLIPLKRVPPTWLTYLLTPSHWGDRISTYEFEGGHKYLVHNTYPHNIFHFKYLQFLGYKTMNNSWWASGISPLSSPFGGTYDPFPSLLAVLSLYIPCNSSSYTELWLQVICLYLPYTVCSLRTKHSSYLCLSRTS